MKKAKKFTAFLFALFMVLGMYGTVSASEVTDNELYNVSETSPVQIENDIAVIDATIPDTDYIVNLNESSYSFYGTATSSTLYTNCLFTGKSTVHYTITNKCDTDLTVKLFFRGRIRKAKITVPANTTITGTFTGLNSSKYYYLSFSAPSHFSGSIY